MNENLKHLDLTGIPLFLAHRIGFFFLQHFFFFLSLEVGV